MKKFLVLGMVLWFIYVPFNSVADIPPGYYDSAAGLTGQALKTALYNIIKGHTSVTYSNLYSAYVTTDNFTGNKVWDMYSLKANGTADYWFTNSASSSDQCGSYSAEGDCYNREHSTPSSWFNDATPMYTDLFNVYPTDGYVNNRRSNYPLADVNSASWTSTNGSMLGSCGAAGYTGTVFEPIDTFKGDFARTFLYMATRYQDVVSSWPANSTECAAVYAGNSTTVFKTWYITMLLTWCALDPVSQKERDRNDAVYAIQNNRNPYIDHPEWIDAIWGPTAVIENIEVVSYTHVFPVPANNQLNISVDVPEITEIGFSIFSCDGKCILEESSTVLENVYTLDVTGIADGIYYLKIISDAGIEVKKIIIENR